MPDPLDPESTTVALVKPGKAVRGVVAGKDKFGWTAKKHRAAYLLSLGEYTYDEIASQIGARNASPVATWLKNLEFQQQVEANATAFKEAIMGEGIALRQRRVQALNDRWGRLQQIMDDRARYATAMIEETAKTDPERADFLRGQGITTGMVVRRQKMVGTGRQSTMIEEYETDRSLWEAFLAHEKQSAQETGQWVERREHSGEVDVKFTIESLRAALKAPEPEYVEGEVISVT